MKKILVANRGEIAIRVMRSAKEMGIETVAVFSEADRNSLHVLLADEAVCIGPPLASESYLSMDNVIEAAKKTNADAIHPGYGFLSENAEFSKRVTESGITFIGPSPESIKSMGDKIQSKIIAEKAGVPLIPGTKEPLTSADEAIKIAEDIGYPVMVKASAGGGGKGMRIVENKDELKTSIERAQSEAKSAFGNADVFIEKCMVNPKHIEVQIFRDQKGNCVHLNERECSIQRRHQKVVEESPSPVISVEQRSEMGECAKSLANACNYEGAGTVEFILDQSGDFYFLEMNTRLQVEHPVTEYITGYDLVKEQINVAQGKPLSFSQADVTIDGHAIELRVYAEDPESGFLPVSGKIYEYFKPDGPGVRVDDSAYQGYEINTYYDPLIGKLIVHSSTREEAIAKMIRAIKEYRISGIPNTLNFGLQVLQHDEFANGQYSTSFVENHYNPHPIVDSGSDFAAAINASVPLLKSEQKAISQSEGTDSKWKRERLK